MEFLLSKLHEIFQGVNLLEYSNKAKALRTFYFIGVSPLIIAYYAAAFYPGYLTADSLYMLSQGAGLQPLSNWHPPFITMVWGWLFSLFKSAGGVWLIQISLYVGAVIFFVTRLSSTIVATIVFALLLLYPPIFTNMAALWKDCWVISTTLICAAYSIEAIKSKKTSPLLFCVALFLISSLIRIDYAIIALPFLLSAIAFGCSDKSHTTINSIFNRRNFLLALAVMIALVLCTKIIGARVVDKFNPWLSVAIWDIAGAEENSTPETSVPGYKCSTSDPLVFGENRKFEINLPEHSAGTNIQQESKKYLKLWLSTVVAHPTAYAKHRICVGKSFLALGTDEVHYPYPRAEMSESSLTQHAERSALNIDRYWFYDKNAHGPMFRYWYYIASCLILLGLCVIAKRISVIQIAAFSSVVLAASRFLILPAADFRYGLWIVIGTIALVALLFDRLFDYSVKSVRVDAPE